MTAADASDLCLTCGLCCDGTLFGDVELQAGDDRARLRALGLPVIRSRSGRRPSRWLQPCPALGAGCRCAIYRERPLHCREFDCALLQSVKAGALEIADARRTIRQTRRRVETVKRLLRELGDTQEHDSLAKRFRRTRRRFENQELAEAPDREERLDQLAALTMAVHELQFALRLAFYPDPGDGPGQYCP
ncbi:MAG TPA: YkgJ family cysteine cluster protein [Verrucomicrobiota bacterium]|nr:YkgJ family cysteine cluster protein [Verrucomicrobiota bacterium]